MFSILHLSDLHFGEILKAPFEHILSSNKGALELSDIFFKHYKENNSSLPSPNCIVITGDITSGANSGEYDYVEIFLKKILERFSLDTSKLLVMPGNHDISWSAAQLDRPEKYSAFRKFYTLLFGTEWSHLKPAYIDVDIPGEEGRCVIFGFNSCSVEDQNWKGLGYIHKDQLNFQDDFYKQNENTSIIRLAALHHHVLPVHNYHPSFKKFNPRNELDDEKNPPPISLLLNSSEFLKKCRKNEVHAILHGHSHAPYSVTHTNYIDLDFNSEKHVPRSIAVIGCGSPTSKRIEEYKKNHYQYINFKRSSKQTFFVNIWSYRSTDHQPNITEMELSHPITMPGGKAELIISNELLSILRKKLNKIVVNNYAIKLQDEKFSFLSHKLYDELLAETTSWLEGIYNKNFGNAIISRFIPDLGIYKHIAIYHYDEEVRHFAYNIAEQSITTECGRNCTSQLISSRVNSRKASRKRDNVYKKSLQGEDQSCLAVPLNAAGNKQNAYAVLHFAKSRFTQRDEFKRDDLRIVEKIAYILEDALRQAEIADVAEKRRQLILLFNKLRSFRNETVKKTALGLFDDIVEDIFNHLGLHYDHKDAVGIFFPKILNGKVAECIAHRGFDGNAKKMEYELNKRQGLTGAVLDLRKSDYCINHLSRGSKSVILKAHTTDQCAKASESIRDHHLSWVGVPLGKATETYNRGALVINISTPLGIEAEDYMWSNYVEPLEIIAELLDPIIEGPWKDYYDLSENSSQR